MQIATGIEAKEQTLRVGALTVEYSLIGRAVCILGQNLAPVCSGTSEPMPHYNNRIALLNAIGEKVGLPPFGLCPNQSIILNAIDDSNVRTRIESPGAFVPPTIVAVHDHYHVTIPVNGQLDYGVAKSRTAEISTGVVTLRGRVQSMIFGSMSENAGLELRLDALHEHPILPSRHTGVFKPVEYLNNTSCHRKLLGSGYFALYTFSDIEVRRSVL